MPLEISGSRTHAQKSLSGSAVIPEQQRLPAKERTAVATALSGFMVLQMPRALAFAAANSSSVRMPAACI